MIGHCSAPTVVNYYLAPLLPFSSHSNLTSMNAWMLVFLLQISLPSCLFHICNFWYLYTNDKYKSKGSDLGEATSQLSLNLMRGNAMMLSSRHQGEDIPMAEVDGIETEIVHSFFVTSAPPNLVSIFPHTFSNCVFWKYVLSSPLRPKYIKGSLRRRKKWPKLGF